MWNYGLGEGYQTVSAAGTTQTTATLLPAQINNVTVAASGSGVLLPPVAPGCVVGVYNSAANAVKVYPNSGTQINGLGNNLGVLLSQGSYCLFDFATTGQWFANLSA